jgi:hypothetical protein
MFIDIENFSGRPDPVQKSLRRSLYEVVRTAATDANLSWESLRSQDRGDGLLLPVASDVSPVVLAGDFIRALDAGLAEKASMSNDLYAMRLRVALHLGVATEDDEGWYGRALNTTCHLANAHALRTTLGEAGRAHLALIVSDAFYQAVIGPGHRSLDPSTFAPLTLDLKKDRDAPAWIQVPGYAAPPGLPIADWRPGSPRGGAPPGSDDSLGSPTAPSPADVGTPMKAGGSVTVHGVVIGDQVAGDKTVHYG